MSQTKRIGNIAVKGKGYKSFDIPLPVYEYIKLLEDRLKQTKR